MSTVTISPLRQRMIEDMNARKLCAGTQRGHIHSCKRFAAFLKQSPDTATAEDIRRFQLHLSETCLDVCCCFFGRSLSVARISSITPVNSSSFGRNGGFLRTYPGGTENFSIFETVLALMPNRSAAARSLIPSIRTACRTRA
jgi:Phage integrase, N-terminal SAM-like domain